MELRTRLGSSLPASATRYPLGSLPVRDATTAVLVCPLPHPPAAPWHRHWLARRFLPSELRSLSSSCVPDWATAALGAPTRALWLLSLLPHTWGRPRTGHGGFGVALGVESQPLSQRIPVPSLSLSHRKTPRLQDFRCLAVLGRGHFGKVAARGGHSGGGRAFLRTLARRTL